VGGDDGGVDIAAGSAVITALPALLLVVADEEGGGGVEMGARTPAELLQPSGLVMTAMRWGWRLQAVGESCPARRIFSMISASRALPSNFRTE